MGCKAGHTQRPRGHNCRVPLSLSLTSLRTSGDFRDVCTRDMKRAGPTRDAQIHVGDLVAADAVHSQHCAGAPVAARQGAQVHRDRVHLRRHRAQRRQRLLQVCFRETAREAIILHACGCRTWPFCGSLKDSWARIWARLHNRRAVGAAQRNNVRQTRVGSLHKLLESSTF